MSHWLDDSRYRHEVVTVRTLWVTLALSLLVHVGALFLVLQQTRLLAPADEGPELASERMQVRLAAVPRPAPVPTPEPPREIVALPNPPAQSQRAAVRKQPPAVIASTEAAPAISTPPSPEPSVPAPPRTSPPVEGDLWSYIQARRRARGEPEAPAIDDQKAEPNASLAANLPAPATGIATPDKRGGGIFEIKRMDYDDGAFLFFGWNKDMGRKTPQLIEVRRGDNSDIRIAVVRKMIAIIREYSKGDFVWRSPRHDYVVLSARLSDNAALESFLMRDFFDDPRPLQ